MADIQDWFTNESLAQFAMALIAIRVAVELTKDMFDALWRYVTGHKPWTVLYAMAWGAFIVFVIKGGEWQANILNVILLTFMSKLMDLEKGKTN